MIALLLLISMSQTDAEPESIVQAGSTVTSQKQTHVVTFGESRGMYYQKFVNGIEVDPNSPQANSEREDALGGFAIIDVKVSRFCGSKADWIEGHSMTLVSPKGVPVWKVNYMFSD